MSDFVVMNKRLGTELGKLNNLTTQTMDYVNELNKLNSIWSHVSSRRETLLLHQLVVTEASLKACQRLRTADDVHVTKLKCKLKTLATELQDMKITHTEKINTMQTQLECKLKTADNALKYTRAMLTKTQDDLNIKNNTLNNIRNLLVKPRSSYLIIAHMRRLLHIESPQIKSTFS